jgi:putative radical SAM enzyme (TIGR03279 family)
MAAILVESVRDGSPAQRAGMRAGDRVVRLNGLDLRDALDAHFHASGESEVLLEIHRDGRAEEVLLERREGEDLGLTFAADRIRTCGNQCVFCFVDQNPAGLRPTLYVKDEDYRLSFLHGNFVTLTNMKEWEIHRVVEQRLSPIYISVHSTNPDTRRRLLRTRKDRDIVPILEYFRDHDIVMHTQVVLCPGINDGDDLEGTIRDLAAFHPAAQSLAIVPLGMTDHREGLPALAPVTPKLAERLLEQVERHQRAFQAQWGIRFVYLADEWYRLLGRPVPPESQYDGYPQLENGIGMTRSFLNRLGRQRRVFPWSDGRKRRVTVVTGALFRPILEPALSAKLARTGEPVEVAVTGAENRFFGRRVTVAGLLAGADILRVLHERDPGDAVFIPPSTLNDDDLFLDDLSLEGLRAEVGVPVHPGFRDRAW